MWGGRIKHHDERGLKGGTPHSRSNLIAFFINICLRWPNKKVRHTLASRTWVCGMEEGCVG